MNNKIEILLNRQSEWQKSRSTLTWSEKLRQSVLLREAGVALRGGYHIDECSNIVAEEQVEYNREMEDRK